MITNKVMNIDWSNKNTGGGLQCYYKQTGPTYFH